MANMVSSGKMMKAQFWSFDVVFAMVVFTIAITILSVAWLNINNQLSVAYGNGASLSQVDAQALIQNLFTTGYPSDWQARINVTNTTTWNNVSVGMVANQGSANLSSSKIYTMLAMTETNYQAMKQELGIGFDYYIMIYGSSVNITMGRSPGTNYTYSIYVEKRGAFLNGAPVTVEAIVWSNSQTTVT